MKASAILLSAGLSSRMKPLPQKGLLRWEEKTLFEHQLQMLTNSALSEVIVVVGFNADIFMNISKTYPVKTVYNEDYILGKCSSIKKGLQFVDHASNMILIIAVDQPTDSNIINLLLQSLNDSACSIAIPSYKGKRGHPILFSEKISHELQSIQEETHGLRNIIRKYENQILEVSINNPLIKLNINSPVDYQNAIVELKPTNV